MRITEPSHCKARGPHCSRLPHAWTEDMGLQRPLARITCASESGQHSRKGLVLRGSELDWTPAALLQSSNGIETESKSYQKEDPPTH